MSLTAEVNFMTTSISISPKYTSEDWEKLQFHTADDWDKAVKMLEDRIIGRFFEVVARIRQYGYAGFAILALDCLLIETLEQFHQGVNETPRGKLRPTFAVFSPVRRLAITSHPRWLRNSTP